MEIAVILCIVFCWQVEEEMEYLGRKPVVSPDSALAADIFDQFCSAYTLKSILGHFRHLCDVLKIKPTNFPQFYPKLKVSFLKSTLMQIWTELKPKIKLNQTEVKR